MEAVQGDVQLFFLSLLASHHPVLAGMYPVAKTKKLQERRVLLDCTCVHICMCCVAGFCGPMAVQCQESVTGPESLENSGEAVS